MNDEELVAYANRLERAEDDEELAMLFAAAGVSEACAQEILVILSRLKAERMALRAVVSRDGEPTEKGSGQPKEVLLNADQAVELLGGGVTRKWLLRHSRGQRFRRDLSRKAVVFEEKGLRAWVASRKGAL